MLGMSRMVLPNLSIIGRDDSDVCWTDPSIYKRLGVRQNRLPIEIRLARRLDQ